MAKASGKRNFMWPVAGLFLASCNLALAYHFRENASLYHLPSVEDIRWFFLSVPVFNWGGFFVDGDAPTVHRLPTVVFLIWASLSLLRYSSYKRTTLQQLSAIVLLGGLGGLTLDILAYGSVCDWLGFSLPDSGFYSMSNISDLMILFSAPIAAFVCFDRWLYRIPAFCFAMAVIGANTYYHFGYLLFGIQPTGLS